MARLHIEKRLKVFCLFFS